MTDGLILVDKPAGRTSHDVVAAVRRELGRPRTGHAGTLDPFATGLLIVLVGRATRVQRFVMGLPKSYEAVARFGAVSTTGDPEGEITETGVLPPDDLALPTGVIRQRPPVYSAVKVAGRRAYELARRGEAVELPEREVTVTRFELLHREGERAAFAIDCSSGTYVRSLIAGLGDAYCEQLRRMAIGPFSLDEADPARILPLGDALARIMPVLELEGEIARRAGHGQAIDGEAGGHVLLADADGPIAVAEPREGPVLKPVVGFRGS
jgi:tRNA pseudouridine55 synthase